MTSLLGEAISGIKANFTAFNIYRYADVASYCKFLPEAGSDRHIQDYEHFWFTFETLLGLADEEELRPKSIEDGMKFSEDSTAKAKALNLYRKVVCSNIYTLIRLLVDSKLLDENDARRHAELRYAYLLRNDFIHNPEFDHLLEFVGHSFFWKNDERFLPTVVFGPRSGGAPFDMSCCSRLAWG